MSEEQSATDWGIYMKFLSLLCSGIITEDWLDLFKAQKLEKKRRNHYLLATKVFCTHELTADVIVYTKPMEDQTKLQNRKEQVRVDLGRVERRQVKICLVLSVTMN